MALINPAIEANEIFQLKELVSKTCFRLEQDRLMHIISSDADRATSVAFKVGQWLGTRLRWNQEGLKRKERGREIEIHEKDLDTITVGNFFPFQTGYLKASSNNDYKGPSNCIIKSLDGTWDYISYVGHDECVYGEDEDDLHISVSPNEPIAFIKTDGNFIESHNDVFNNQVAAYLAAITAEARYKRILQHEGPYLNPERLPQCKPQQRNAFDFGRCFHAYLGEFVKTNP